ncbi:SWIM zinc finger family protein [uncultured Phascolarctobacterium sp.]|uniref:SWIM zinc finger family protein n=1 Tax=uncultured Phascolarctobacterium sp. TaxID=512296 RepID=UPI0025D2E63A|nr:SWIM zinc finger family protein [uncultured Phascolarctobacterium sp.]
MDTVKINGWRHLFQKHILSRGFSYCLLDYVRNITRTALGYTSVVSGTEDYTVNIVLRNEKVVQMSCECPYAEDGNNCKHMAAVLYKLTGEQDDLSVQKRKDERFKKAQELSVIIERMTETELREFLLKLALDNSDVRKDLLLKYAKFVGGPHIQELKGKIYDIADLYEYEDGFIDWNHAYDYICSLSAYLEDTVKKLLESNFCIQAFELVYEGIFCASEQEMDDSSGGLTMLGDTCSELWRLILKQSDSQQKRKIFAAAKRYLQEFKESDFIYEYLYNLLIQEFHEEDFLQEKLKMLDEDITGMIADSDRHSIARYYIEDKLLNRIQIMRQLKYADKEILAYQNKYRNFPRVRLALADTYMRMNKVQAAVQLLIEGKQADAKSLGIVDDYIRRLLEIYRESNQFEAYKQELINYIFSIRQDNLQYVFMLKELVLPNEWSNYREKILAARTCYWIRYNLLVQENMHERLLEEILQSGIIHDLDSYEKVLRERYPEQVRNQYIQYVTQEVKIATQRSAYQKLMKYLKKIKRYPDGIELTKAIASEWRDIYRRRPAMLDELHKAGF